MYADQERCVSDWIGAGHTVASLSQFNFESDAIIVVDRDERVWTLTPANPAKLTEVIEARLWDDACARIPSPILRQVTGRPAA